MDYRTTRRYTAGVWVLSRTGQSSWELRLNSYEALFNSILIARTGAASGILPAELHTLAHQFAQITEWPISEARG